MSIEALAAVGPSSTPKVAVPFELDPAMTMGTSAEASPAADAFRSILSNLHTDISTYSADPKIGNAVETDPVATAKQEVLPQSEVGTTAGEGNNLLRKSFDHAMFVTLVSQVVSGLSQTTSTLIRQQ